MTRTSTPLRVRFPLAATGFAVAVTFGAQGAWAQTTQMGAAESFAVLGNSAVTNTGVSHVAGDVGTFPATAVTGFPPGTLGTGSVIRQGGAVAAQARLDAVTAYDSLVAMTCPVANNLTGQNLGGKALAPGVYCFDGNASLTGALTLTGTGPWTFQIGGALSVAASASVLLPDVTTECAGSDVFWQVGGTGATVGAGATFVGNILARTAVALAAGAAIDGRAVSIDAAVTMTASTVAACSFGGAFPPHAPFKVTGGGQLVPIIPALRGNGAMTFGFVARPGLGGAPATGRLNLLNHATKNHVRGPVTDVVVVAVNPDGTPKTARFSGTCGAGCTFSATAEDIERHDQHGRRDQLGIVVVSGGVPVESWPMQPIRRGNIRFHTGAEPELAVDVNDVDFQDGTTMIVSALLTPGAASAPADAYIVLQLPDGQLMSWTGSGLVPGLVPIVSNLTPMEYEGVVAQITIPAGAPVGTYSWLSALTSAGTLNLVSPITETVFTITR
jgi:hypothetical protein